MGRGALECVQMQDSAPTSLPAERACPKCAGMGFLWLCVSALIVLPLIHSIFFLCNLPSEMDLETLDVDPRILYASLPFAALGTGVFLSLMSYFPWLLVAYGLGLCCSRFWLRALWAVLLVACGVGMVVFLLGASESCDCTVGPDIPARSVLLLLSYEAVCLFSYLLPYWWSCRRAARR